MYGIMLTTWHTLKNRMISIPDCAAKLGAKSFVWQNCSGAPEITATMLRRISFEGNTYESSGWSKQQIEI